jgi:hypothetical protein
MHDSNRPVSCFPQLAQFLNCPRGHLPLLHRNSAKINLHGRVRWHVVSSVTCHVTWHVMEYSGHQCFPKAETIYSIASGNLRLHWVSVRLREWNCSCSN